MSKVFLKAYDGLIFTEGQLLVWEFHGQNLKATVKGVRNLALGGSGSGGEGNKGRVGILTSASEINFLKDPSSAIKIKSSAKRLVIFCPLLRVGVGCATDP